MNDSIFRQIGTFAKYLDVDFDEQEIVNYKQLSRRIYNNINRALR